ncbi:MAG: TlpA family protein disulfide reductase, partial [Nocardioidaceae bacterium]
PTDDPAGERADGQGGFTADVDVDTPELRAAKKQAGIADCPAAPAEGGAVPEGALPQVTLPCLGGGADVDLSTLRGPMVVNLWAQWCGPCREELPYYQRLHERAGDQVEVLGVDYQDTRPDWALDLLRETGVTFPSVADPGGELRVPLRVRGLPGILFVDGDGRLVHQEFAVIESYEQLTGLVEQHLGVAVGSAG